MARQYHRTGDARHRNHAARDRTQPPRSPEHVRASGRSIYLVPCRGAGLPATGRIPGGAHQVHRKREFRREGLCLLGADLQTGGTAREDADPHFRSRNVKLSMADLGLSRGTLAVPNEKAGPISARSAKRAGLDFLEVPEPHQIAAMSASRWQSARGLMCLSKASSEDLLL